MENIVITEQGKQFMSKVISETESMTFTKIAVSDYDYSGIELQNISELQSVKQTAIISKISRTDGKTVEILAAINNEQIPEAYYVRSLGVYVKDSSENEILYGISISGENPDYMPAYEGKTLSGVSYRINVAVEDSEYITVNVNPAAVPTIMQVEDIDTAFREHTEDKVSHITAAERKKWDAVTEKVNKEKGKGLSHNDFTDADKKKLDGIATGANKTVIDSELSETSTNPVENKLIYQEKIKRMAQNWSRSEQYSSLGIGEPDSSTQIGSYLDVESGKVYYGGNSSWSYVYTLSSIYDVLDNKVNKSNIVNNLVTTEEGYALDARQGEALDGKITELKKSVSDGKSAIASAITNAGVSTLSDDSFATMSEHIGNIFYKRLGMQLSKYYYANVNATSGTNGEQMIYRNTNTVTHGDWLGHETFFGGALTDLNGCIIITWLRGENAITIMRHKSAWQGTDNFETLYELNLRYYHHDGGTIVLNSPVLSPGVEICTLCLACHS